MREDVADPSTATGNRELDLRTGLDENSISLDEGGKVGEKKLAIAQSAQWVPSPRALRMSLTVDLTG